MAPRLKVFVTSDGLTDYVVATSSRAKALAAWGVRQDLFKEGVAHETNDADLVKAATAQPDQVLRKPAGGRAALQALKVAKPKAPAGPSKAALKKVADLEKRIETLETSRQRAAAELQRKKALLDQELADLEIDTAAKRERLDAALSAAKQALG
jgi:hypothetical protein